jgi:hypothetical protein
MDAPGKLEKVMDGLKNERVWRHGKVIKASFDQASRAHHAEYRLGQLPASFWYRKKTIVSSMIKVTNKLLLSSELSVLRLEVLPMPMRPSEHQIEAYNSAEEHLALVLG